MQVGSTLGQSLSCERVTYECDNVDYEGRLVQIASAEIALFSDHTARLIQARCEAYTK
jgi:hypothetical protein